MFLGTEDLLVSNSEHRAKKSDPHSDALSTLTDWEGQQTRVAFGHYRLRDGVIQTGAACLRNVGQRWLTLETRGTSLHIDLGGARYEFGRMGFIEKSDLRRVADIDGLSIFLKSQDWLFLCVKPKNLTHSALTSPIRYQPKSR